MLEDVLCDDEIKAFDRKTLRFEVFISPQLDWVISAWILSRFDCATPDCSPAFASEEESGTCLWRREGSRPRRSIELCSNIPS